MIARVRRMKETVLDNIGVQRVVVYSTQGWQSAVLYSKVHDNIGDGRRGHGSEMITG
jgi:hypothetical protein